MRRWLTLGLIFISASAQISVAYAQEEIPLSQTEIRAVITGPEESAVRRAIVLSAAQSRRAGEHVQYVWTVEGRTISRNIDAIFTPERPGQLTFRLTVRSVLDGRTVESSAEHVVQVFGRKIILITDGTPPEDQIRLLRTGGLAPDGKTFVRMISSEPGPSPLVSDDSLYALLREDANVFEGSETIVIWTEGIRGLQALLRASQEEPAFRAFIRNQDLLLLSDTRLTVLSRTSRGVLAALAPRRVTFAVPEALPAFIAMDTMQAFEDRVREENIEILELDRRDFRIQPWRLLSRLTTAMMAEGVSSDTILLLLLLPVIATILAFLKQVVGVTSFGLFTPSIVALSFLAIGWALGVVFLIVVVVTGYATREFMRKFRLLYIPKVAIILTVVSLTLLFMLAAGAAFGVRYSRETLFILLMMSTLAESFMNLKSEEGWLSAVLATGESILAALVCVFIVQMTLVQSFLLAYPEAILLTLLINIALGRFTGLRLVEYFRFREVFKHLQEE